MVPDHTRGAHPTASGRRQTVVLFWQSYPALTNGGVVDAVVPCGLGGNSLATWVRDFNFEAPAGYVPNSRSSTTNSSSPSRAPAGVVPHSRSSMGKSSSPSRAPS